MNFDETIKHLRAKKNITQRDLAEKIGVSPVQLNRYEKGLMRPRLPILAKLAEALDVDYSVLSESIKSTTSSKKSLIDSSIKVSQKRVQSVTLHIEELSFQERFLVACNLFDSLRIDVNSMLKNEFTNE